MTQIGGIYTASFTSAGGQIADFTSVGGENCKAFLKTGPPWQNGWRWVVQAGSGHFQNAEVFFARRHDRSFRNLSVEIVGRDSALKTLCITEKSGKISAK